MKEIEIYVTAISEKFNFRLDEYTPLAVLAEEVASMVGHREHCDVNTDADKPIFYSRTRQQILDGDRTFADLGVKTGELIYLV